MPRTTFAPPHLARTALATTILLYAAAAPALAQHRARLSADLAAQMASGYQTIDVIVHGDRATVDQLARRYNVVVKRYLTKAGAVLRVNAGQLAAIAGDDGMDHLSGDIKIRPDDVDTASIGADQLWTGAGGLPALSGEGIGVAVIDSGIDATHSALQGRVVASVDFTGGDGQDRYGHGTHVAGIIAGARGRTADTSDYRGVASGASLINLRALGDDGSGTASNVIEAIDWAVDHRLAYNIRVINLSLGAPALQPYRDDPLCEAVERAAQAGIVVVAAAGNYGRSSDGKLVIGGIVTPGISPYALTVGAVDTHYTADRSDDTVATYSSRGPTLQDLVMKPDVAAPGSHIVSAEAAGSVLATLYSQRHVAGAGSDGYMQLSGTSMATAMVAGAVALLLQEQAGLTPSAVKAVLQATSTFMPSAGLIGCGAGDVDVMAAAVLLGSRVSTRTSPVAVSAGFVASTSNVLSRVFAQQILWTNSLKNQQILWTNILKGQQILWTDTAAAQQVLWTDTLKGQQILWTDLLRGQQILWTDTAAAQQILWTDTLKGQQILWTDLLQGQQILWTDSLVGQQILWTDSLVDEQIPGITDMPD